MKRLWHWLMRSLGIDHCFECEICGAALCPFGERLHWHHDGCPACHCPARNYATVHFFPLGWMCRCGVSEPKGWKTDVEEIGEIARYDATHMVVSLATPARGGREG